MISSTEIGRSTPGVRVQCSVAVRLGGDLRQDRRIQSMIVQIPLRLDGEELRRQHHAGLAVPIAEPVLRRCGVEGAGRMLVEADRHPDVVVPRTDGPVGHRQRRATGGAAVRDVDELDSREPEVGNQRVGVAGGVTASEGELDVAPLDAGVGEGSAGRDGALLASGHAFGPPEGVDADADDGDFVSAHPADSSSMGVNAYVMMSPAGVNASVTSCTRWPMCTHPRQNGRAVIRRAPRLRGPRNRRRTAGSRHPVRRTAAWAGTAAR